MSAFSGRQGKGARRRLRALKREEAEARNALTPPERRYKTYVQWPVEQVGISEAAIKAGLAVLDVTS